MLPGVLHAPYGDGGLEFITDLLFARVVPPGEVAAIVVEPVLGEGGYVIPPRTFIEGLRDLCDRHGILLVADEVQSGMGRTGKMWAVQHFDVEPDILVSGKGIASGMPLGAMTAKADLMSWQMGAHGSTYGGNPVACAAALATMDLLQGGLVDNAARVGEAMLETLRGTADHHPIVRAVRGLGLMIGVEFESPEVADAVEIASFRQGLLVLRAGDSTVRIAPPLIITDEQAKSGLRIFDEACSLVEERGAAAFGPLLPGHEAGPDAPETA
jgi:4-aminobutyrate aminotransferase